MLFVREYIFYRIFMRDTQTNQNLILIITMRKEIFKP